MGACRSKTLAGVAVQSTHIWWTRCVSHATPRLCCHSYEHLRLNCAANAQDTTAFDDALAPDEALRRKFQSKMAGTEQVFEKPRTLKT